MTRRIFAALVFVMMISGTSVSAEREALLVTQPAYRSMSFYVYKPQNVQGGFYVTFDGYLVYKDNRGVWCYGSADKSGITKTGYVVGSVLPYIVKIKPYDREVSSVAPILNSNKTVETNSEVSGIVYPLTPLQNVSDWTQDSSFLAVSKWRKSVNKIGVTSRPKMPVAWRGEYPEVVYVWNGQRWLQISSRSQKSTAIKILRRAIYDLTVSNNRLNKLHWTDNDTQILAQYSALWGYEWVGQIILGKEFLR